MEEIHDRGSCTERLSSVYRIYDQRGELIYVGMTDRGHVRLGEHLSSKFWANQISQTHWEHFPTRDEAAARERELISRQHPRHNVVYRDVDGKPARMEFRLVSKQYDLMRRTHAEVRNVKREWNRINKMLDDRFATLDRIARKIAHALREMRPLTEDEVRQIEAYLRHLEKMESQKPVSASGWAK